MRGVGEANARRPVVAVRCDFVNGVDRCVGIGRIDGRILQSIFRRGEVVVAHADVDGEIGIDLDVILRERAGAPAVGVKAGSAVGDVWPRQPGRAG